MKTQVIVELVLAAGLGCAGSLLATEGWAVTGQPSIFWHEGQWQTYHDGVWTPYGQGGEVSGEKSGASVGSGAGAVSSDFADPGNPQGGARSSLAGRRSPTVILAGQSMGMGQPTIGVGQPTAGIGQPTIGIGKPTIGIGQPTIGIGKPTIGIGQPTIGIGKPTIGIGKPTIGIGQPMGTSSSHSSGQRSPGAGNQR